MERLDPTILSALLLQAPGWARIGLTAPTPRMREQAARELMTYLVEHLDRVPSEDRNQLVLPL